MKRKIFTLITCIALLTVTKAQYVTIPDVNFRNALKTLYPTAFNGAGQMDTTKSVIINAQGLNVSNKNIQDLTGVQYFKNLYNLLCSNNQLTTLPTLPTINLSYLNCSYNQIAAISTTAANLSYLYCSHNLLSTLPNYTNTSGYGHIDCSYNLIGSISAIPNVAYFNCDNNLLTSLPALPIHIQKLFCNNNQLTSLPTLSKIQTSVDTALVISCFGNQIYCLPKLPSGPLNFYSKLVVDTSMIKCLPNLPNTVNWQHQVVGTLDIFTSDIDSFGVKLPVCNATNNANNCHGYPSLEGVVYNDNNSNSIIDANDFRRANIKVSLQTGESTFTNDTGYYKIWADSIGSNTLSITAPRLYNSLPISIAHNFTTYTDNVTDTFALQPSVIKDSLAMNLTSWWWAIRPGGWAYYFAGYENVGTTVLNATMTINFDSSKVSFDSFYHNWWWGYYGGTVPTSFTNTGNSIAIPISLLPGQRGHYLPIFKGKTSLQIGDSITITASLIGGTAAANDTSIIKVRSSFDPNDKQSTPELSPAQVQTGNYIDYTVRFQNTGNDTALSVVIADTLSNLLKNNAIQIVSSSHLCRTTLQNGIIYFEFLNINLPDSNVNKLASHGYVRFRILPKTTLTVGTIIPNKASIYFDYNKPVVTNTTTTIIKNPILPLKLLNYQVKIKKATSDNTLVENIWSTANEINTSHFNVQRSFNGKNFSTVGKVNAKGFGDYSFTDALAKQFIGTVYYRLQMLDNDGKIGYTAIEKVTIKTQSASSISIFPNPAKDFVVIEGKEMKQINIIDNLGRVVIKNTLQNSTLTKVNVQALSKGIYNMQIILATGETKNEKLVIE